MPRVGDLPDAFVVGPGFTDWDALGTRPPARRHVTTGSWIAMLTNVLDRADVVVVGGGTVGVSAAFHLTELGLDVVLVEREHVAWGASGRNAGFLWMHHRNPGLPLKLARAGMDLIKTLSPDLVSCCINSVAVG